MLDEGEVGIILAAEMTVGSGSPPSRRPGSQSLTPARATSADGQRAPYSVGPYIQRLWKFSMKTCSPTIRRKRSRSLAQAAIG